MNDERFGEYLELVEYAAQSEREGAPLPARLRAEIESLGRTMLFGEAAFRERLTWASAMFRAERERRGQS